MPKTAGFDLIRRISISYPNIRILVLSSMDEQIYGGRVRSIGGHGYVNKTANANIILAACVAVSQSYTFFSTARNGRSGLSDKEKLDSLSDREIQVMKFLTRGMGNLEMATNLNISSKTVATYKHRLFEKLSINGITDLIAFCHKNSLIEG
jgi:two-component system response regulator FimZ (fimbrial Z protein)/two-component system response regulator EvgA